MSLRAFIASSALAVLVVLAGLNKIQRLQATSEALATQLASTQQKADGYELLIQQLATDLAQQRISQQQLLKTQSELATAATARAQTIRSLQRENQELKSWADVDLPAAIQCLRRRPQLATADDYTAWLSGGNPLHPACQ